ncbi:MAG: hypothetical protein CSA33_01320 [Desulfobulbus propionicus]|nr:MAG: hypothetical protein CSA33_01320 [Desulfobulbus propionicus]
MTTENRSKPPEIGPYVFPAILAFFGLWCLWDGWFTVDPAMQKYLLFNRIAAGIFIPWAGIDFYRTRKRLAQAQVQQKRQQPTEESIQ